MGPIGGLAGLGGIVSLVTLGCFIQLCCPVGFLTPVSRQS